MYRSYMHEELRALDIHLSIYRSTSKNFRFNDSVRYDAADNPYRYYEIIGHCSGKTL